MSHTDSDCHPETLIYDCKPETLIYPSLNTLISKVAISFSPSCPFSPACALFSGFSFACALPHLGLLLFSPANRTNVGLLLSSPHSFWHSRLLHSHRTLYVQEHVRMLVRNKYVTQKTAGKDIGKFKSLMGERYSRVLLCTHRRSQCCCK